MTHHGTQIANPHLPVDQAWLDLLHEEILEPALPIIDPHHHLWDGARPRYLLGELQADTATGHNILATVYMECRSMYRATGPEALRSLGETEFIAGTAAMSESGTYGSTHICAGIVGHVDLRLGEDARGILEQHIAMGHGRFRGVRHISAWDASPDTRSTSILPPQGLLGDAHFRSGFAQLAPLGLSFDAWLYHPQIPELQNLAEAFPDTMIVLDHVGGPLGVGPYKGQRDAVFAEWAAHIKAIARCPNVHVKLGGLGMRINGFGLHEGKLPPSSDELAALWEPYIETCINAFGAGRCMFESNFPVDKGSYSYPVLWNAFKKLARNCSADEKAALFRETAARIYMIQTP